jgi:Holliday junction resolvase-like predicted endonuclease
MDIYEEAVLNYITSSNNRFVNPQFNIEWDEINKIGGSLPDFVVLDFEKKTIYIVEVTKAYDIKNLLLKVEQRRERWIEPIKKSLNDFFENWEFHVTLFLRDERVEYAINKTKKYNKEVSVISLKKINCFLGNAGCEENGMLESH